MEPYIKNLGKVSITVEDLWDINKEYEKLSIVHSYVDNSSYISKKDVPSNIELTNSDYWMPIIRYNNEDLDSIKDYLIEIEKITYPLILSISGVSEIYEKGIDTTVTLKFKVSFKGVTLNIEDLYLEVNNIKLDNLSFSEVINDTKTYKVTVEYVYSLFDESITMTDNATATVIFVNPCWFGFNEYDTMSEIDMDETRGFTKYIKISPNGTYTITGNEEGYIWLCVPNTMTINKVTMSGFEIPIDELNTGGVSGYRNYRSSNKLKAGSYTILIS